MNENIDIKALQIFWTCFEMKQKAQVSKNYTICLCIIGFPVQNLSLARPM